MTRELQARADAQSEYVIEALGYVSDEISLPLPEVEPVALALLTAIASTLERQPEGVAARDFGAQLFSEIDRYKGPGPSQPALFEMAMG